MTLQVHLFFTMTFISVSPEGIKGLISIEYISGLELEMKSWFDMS